jgi:hypothetical protein
MCFMLGAAVLAVACPPTREEESKKTPCQQLPHALPFQYTRPAVGVPVPAEDVSAFTRLVTGFWKQTRFFNWVLDTSHGVDAALGQPEWMVWWTGVELVKEGGRVTFRHSVHGGPDNIMIPTSRVLAQASAGYLLTGDADMGTIVDQYSKGLSATMLGMVWDDADPVRSIMARAVIPNNHDVTLPGGRVKSIDYSAWRHPTQAWNTHTIHVANNPFWGDIWVKNMRSKDDVPHIYLATAMLPYVAECAPEGSARQSAQEALAAMRGFAKDVVDSGYKIRTKDENGVIYTPTEDLASFVYYDAFVPDAECNAKLVSALLGYGETLGNDCYDGLYPDYEDIAAAGHYYNYAIIRNFHVAATLHALLAGLSDPARNLVKGLVWRNDRDIDDEYPPTNKDEWDRDLAVFLVQSAAAGVPLTSREVRLVHQVYGEAAAAMLAYDAWDPWSPSVADGTRGYRPRGHVDVEDMAFFLQLCWSPFRNPASASVIDCDVVANPSRWGE